MNTVKDLLQNTFVDLIKIDEVYDQENKIIEYVESFFKNLGIPTTKDAFRNVIACLPGKGNPIMLNTHLDAPENVPNLDFKIEGDLIHAMGKSILGADPKSGLAVLLELARYIRERKIKTCPIEFVFTRGEEAGLLGAINLDYSLLRSKMGLILDEDGPCTNVVIKAPAYYKLDCKLQGKTVHSRDWREGINAINAIGKIISSFKQGEIVKDVTFNIGILSGGTARNSVAGEATFKSEFRSFETKKMLHVVMGVNQKIKEVAKKEKIKVALEGKLEFDKYCLKKYHPLFKRLKNTFKKIGLHENYYETFGGSDANIFNLKGIRCVPIGSAYYLAHQYTEYVNLNEMKQLLLFLVEFVSTEN